MKPIFDFIPLLIFFALYKMYDIYIATGALIVVTAVQVLVSFALYKKVEKMPLITFLMVALFGGMTIVLHDDSFIKWKVTMLYLVFALGLSVSQIMGKPVIKEMLGNEITLPEAIWTRINWAWVSFFVFCASLNIYIAYQFPLDIWVNFKVFGLLIATSAYMIATAFYIYKHIPKKHKSNTSNVSADD